MSSKKVNSFLFAIIMCLCVSFLLALTSNGLKSRQILNAKIDKQKNILKAFHLIDKKKKYSKNEIQTIYNANIKNMFLNKLTGEIKEDNFTDALPIFVMEKMGVMEKYAIPFKAYGLWSWIYGVIALNSDGCTVIGLTVFKHAETPGLGGEVEKDWFQDQFVNKKIVNNNNEFTSIQIAKSKAVDYYSESELSYSIDGMSGATITSKGLERDLKKELKKYEVLSKKLRRG